MLSKRRGRRRLSAALLAGPLIVVGWLSAPCHAQNGDAEEVVYSAPAQCGDRAVFEGHVRRFLGRETGALDLGIHVVARLERRHAYVLVLDLYGPEIETSRRVIQHPSRCTLLVEIAALIVAMSVDPDAALRFGPDLLASRGLVVTEGSAPPGDGLTLPEPPRGLLAPELRRSPRGVDRPFGPEPPSIERPYAPPRRTDELRLGAYGGVAHGLVPASAGRLSLDAGYIRGRARFDVSATFDGSSRARLVPGSNARARLTAASLSLSGCYHEVFGALELDLCGRLDVGGTRAVPTGVVDPVSRTRAHLRIAVEPRFGLRIRGSGFVGARAFLSYATYQPRFGVAPSGDLALIPRLGLGLMLGGEWRWN